MAGDSRPSKLILIVDDLPEQRDILATLLRFHGYGVIEAGDGESGVRLAAEQSPDLILMDVLLPGIDGLAATRQVKANADSADIPVVIITALVVEPATEVGARAGADGYITKPCEPREILALVQRMIGQSM